jgi:hypothetical protein
MKISKTRLKEIIKEELSGLGESDEAGIPPHVRLQQVATSLGASEEFVASVRAAITTATSTPEGTGADKAMQQMVTALELLLPQQPDTEDPVVDDAEALVLPDEGRAGYERSLRNMARRGNE